MVQRLGTKTITLNAHFRSSNQSLTRVPQPLSLLCFLLSPLTSSPQPHLPMACSPLPHHLPIFSTLPRPSRHGRALSVTLLRFNRGFGDLRLPWVCRPGSGSHHNAHPLPQRALRPDSRWSSAPRLRVPLKQCEKNHKFNSQQQGRFCRDHGSDDRSMRRGPRATSWRARRKSEVGLCGRAGSWLRLDAVPFWCTARPWCTGGAQQSLATVTHPPDIQLKLPSVLAATDFYLWPIIKIHIVLVTFSQQQ